MKLSGPGILLFLNLCFLLPAADAQALEIQKIRDDFFSMKGKPDLALKIYNRMKDANLSRDPVLLAYRGAVSAASAGSVEGVRSKLGYFNRGKDELEKAVSMQPQDAEIKFLRLATQLNAPSFLGYNSKIEEDKKHIISYIVNDKNVNTNLYLRISEYLLTTEILTPSEIVYLKQFIQQNKPK